MAVTAVSATARSAGAAEDETAFDIVVPTIGRPSLRRLLDALAAESGLGAAAVILVDDRRARRGRPPSGPLEELIPAALRARTRIVASGGRGPAAARNVGWHVATAPWIVFLDDDVVPEAGWGDALARDLATAAPTTAAIQASIAVPPPPDGRRPTDWERNVARLANATWITADLAVRRDVLDAVDGFDERFPRAYREDTDFQLRAMAAGHEFELGSRNTEHPVPPAAWWISMAAQRGNADDALLRARHGPEVLERGRRRRHQAVTASLVVAFIAGARRHRRLAALALTAWVGGTAELAFARLRGGPKRPREIATMVVTSIALPPLATYHWWRGQLRWRHVTPAAALPSGHG